MLSTQSKLDGVSFTTPLTEVAQRVMSNMMDNIYVGPYVRILVKGEMVPHNTIQCENKCRGCGLNKFCPECGTRVQVVPVPQMQVFAHFKGGGFYELGSSKPGPTEDTAYYYVGNSKIWGRTSVESFVNYVPKEQCKSYLQREISDFPFPETIPSDAERAAQVEAFKNEHAEQLGKWCEVHEEVEVFWGVRLYVN